MANAYDAILAQYYTPADRKQSFFDSLGALGAGLIAAGSPSTNPGAFGQGVSQGLLGMQHTLRAGEQDALRRMAVGSQVATADLQRQKLAQELEARQRMQAVLGRLFGAPPGAVPAAPPPVAGGNFGPDVGGTPGSTPGPVSGPPGGVATPLMPTPGPTPSAPQPAPPGAGGGGSTNGRSLSEQASVLTQLAAVVMPQDTAQGVALLRLAREFDPNVKAEMTAAGELMLRGPDGRYYSAPGVDRAKAQRAGLIAGAEAGARNASELRYAGPIAAAKAQGTKQGDVALVNVPGIGQVPGSEAVSFLQKRGEASGTLAPQQTPWGTMPGIQATETARNFAGNRLDTGAPGFRYTEIQPSLGAQPQQPPRQEMTNSGFGMTLPPAPTAAPQASVLAQSPVPHPQSAEGMALKSRSDLAAKESEETLTKAKAAAATLRTLQTMKDQVVQGGFTPGPASPMRASASAWLQEIGVRSNLADRITGGQTGFFRMAETQSLQLVQDIAKTFGANPSNYEGQQLAKAIAQTTDPKEAYLAIIDYALGLNQRTVEAWLAQQDARSRGSDAVDVTTQRMRDQRSAMDPLKMFGGQ